ncbi:hypothetical protein VNO80_26292 [Phaseolus coccineus]|uniref:Uncharacterized protein n=1 Tax=Phaseolus coccineus TaxID=3886 RepID=A0AAN9QE88_PHACN
MFYASGVDGFVYNGSMKVVGEAYRSLVSAAEDGSVWMWDVEKGEVIMVFGDELITISDMIVIKGNGGGIGDANSNNNVTAGEGSGSFTFFWVM